MWKNTKKSLYPNKDFNEPKFILDLKVISAVQLLSEKNTKCVDPFVEIGMKGI